MKYFRETTLSLMTAAMVALGAAFAEAGTVSGIFDGGSGTTYDAADGSGNTGPADDQTSYTKTFSFSDGATGVSFDVDLLLTPTGGFIDSANFGHMGVETTTDESGASRALDQAGESLAYTVSSITQTGGPGGATITFDGFTSVNLRFAEGPGDSGRITDGSGSLFDFDNSDGTAEVTNAAGTPFTVNVAGLPNTVVAEWVAPSNSAAGSSVWRVNTVGGQFTVIPEPATFVLTGLALCATGLVRNRRS